MINLVIYGDNYYNCIFILKLLIIDEENDYTNDEQFEENLNDENNGKIHFIIIEYFL